MLGAGWGALGVGSVRRAGWMMSWPRTIVASGVSQTSPVPRSSWNRPSRQPGEDDTMQPMTAIPFTRGVPSADMLPVADLEAAAVTALREDGARALAYSPGGYMPLREWIGERHRVGPARVLLVNGSLQGVAFLAQHLFLGRGGVAITEDPTYDCTLISLRTFGAELVGVPVTPAGVDVDALEQALAQRPARMLYLIPTFQNPAGMRCWWSRTIPTACSGSRAGRRRRCTSWTAATTSSTRARSPRRWRRASAPATWCYPRRCRTRWRVC